MKKLMTMLAAVLISAAAFAQLTPSQLVSWTPSVEALDGDVYRVVFTGKVAEGYHTYTLTDEFSATEVMDPAVEGGELVGKPYELSTPKEELDEFGDPAKHYYNEIIIAQDVKVASGNAVFTGTIFTNACTGGACKAEYYDFDVKVGKSTAVAAASDNNETTVISSGGHPLGICNAPDSMCIPYGSDDRFILHEGFRKRCTGSFQGRNVRSLHRTPLHSADLCHHPSYTNHRW